HGDVAVGDHADKLVVLGDRQGADVHIEHDPGGILQRLIGRDRPDLAAHGFLDEHGWLRGLFERLSRNARRRADVAWTTMKWAVRPGPYADERNGKPP